MWCVEYQGPRAIASYIAELLEPFAEAVSLFESTPDSEIFQIQVLVPEPPHLEDIIPLVAETFPDGDLETLRVNPLPAVNWLARNRQEFKPMTIGPFYIYGTSFAEDLTVPVERIPLQIEASTAFGTGRHGTTQGCLEALATLAAQGLEVKHSLDIGTGTGILALGLAALWPQASVWAFDNDPEAVRKAQENAQINKMAERLTIFEDESPTAPIVRQAQPYQLITANILANPLMQMASGIVPLLAPGGKLVLSGILIEQEDAVRTAYEALGLTLDQVIHHAPWTTLVLHHP